MTTSAGIKGSHPTGKVVNTLACLGVSKRYRTVQTWSERIVKYTSLYEVAILMRRVVGDSLQKLCEQAAVEQDSNKLMQLIEEINRVLEKQQLKNGGGAGREGVA